MFLLFSAPYVLPLFSANHLASIIKIGDTNRVKICYWGLLLFIALLTQQRLANTHTSGLQSSAMLPKEAGVTFGARHTLWLADSWNVQGSQATEIAPPNICILGIFIVVFFCFLTFSAQLFFLFLFFLITTILGLWLFINRTGIQYSVHSLTFYTTPEWTEHSRQLQTKSMGPKPTVDSADLDLTVAQAGQTTPEKEYIFEYAFFIVLEVYI